MTTEEWKWLLAADALCCARCGGDGLERRGVIESNGRDGRRRHRIRTRPCPWCRHVRMVLTALGSPLAMRKPEVETLAGSRARAW